VLSVVRTIGQWKHKYKASFSNLDCDGVGYCVLELAKSERIVDADIEFQFILRKFKRNRVKRAWDELMRIPDIDKETDLEQKNNNVF